MDELVKVNGNGYTYVLKNEIGNVKIGKTKYPENRIRTIETQSGLKIIEHYISPLCSNYGKIERLMHKKFQENRLLGEWFNIDYTLAVQEMQKQPFTVPNQHEDTNNYDFITEMMASYLIKELDNYNGIRYIAEFDLGTWTPTKEDVEFITKDLLNIKDCYIEDCGEIEWAIEVDSLIKSIYKDGITSKNRQRVQKQYKEIFYSFKTGDIRKYQGNDYANFIEKVLGVSYVSENEKWVREKFIINN